MATESTGGGGGAAPSTSSSAPATGGSGASLPGSGSRSQETAVGQAQSQVQSQAPDAGRTVNAAQQQAANSPQERVGASETNPGRLQDKGANPASETQKAGETLNKNGVTQDAGQKQSPEAKAQMQSALDNAGKNGQNGPQQEGSRSAAIREQAKSAPQQAAPSQSIDK